MRSFAEVSFHLFTFSPALQAEWEFRAQCFIDLLNRFHVTCYFMVKMNSLCSSEILFRPCSRCVAPSEILFRPCSDARSRRRFFLVHAAGAWPRRRFFLVHAAGAWPRRRFFLAHATDNALFVERLEVLLFSGKPLAYAPLPFVVSVVVFSLPDPVSLLFAASSV